MCEAYLETSIKDYLANRKEHLRPSTIAYYRHYLSKFLAHAKNIPLTSITPALLRGFSTKWHPTQCVHALLNWAFRDARTIAVNPLKGMKLPSHGRRNRIVSAIEKARILRRSARPFRGFLLGLSESLARPAEMREAKWGDIRVSGGPTFMIQDLVDGCAFFFFAHFKGQERRNDQSGARVIPISPRFGRLLKRLWGNGQRLDSVVFVNRLGQQWTHNAVRCRMRRLRARGDFTADTNGERIVAYTLRHSGATEAVQSGISPLALASLMGHSDVRMTQRYVHLVPEHLLSAMWQLDAFRRGKGRKKDRLGLRRKRPDVEK